MKHYITQIQSNHEQLSQLALKHIDSCKVCKTEYRLMQGITKSISTMPPVRVPANLRARVFARIFEPAYTVWQSFLTVLVLLLSPLIVKFSSSVSNFYLEPVYFYSISIFFAIAGTALLVPLTLGLYAKHTDWFDNLDKSIVNYLQS